MYGIHVLVLRAYCHFRGHRIDPKSLRPGARIVCQRCGKYAFSIPRPLELTIRADTAPLRRALEGVKDSIDAIAYALSDRDDPLAKAKSDALRKHFGKDHL